MEPGSPFPPVAVVSVPAEVETWVEAWGDALGVGERRALERKIAEVVRDAIEARARGALRRSVQRGDGPTVDDAVNQTIVELPTILAAYLEGARRRMEERGRPGGFGAYVVRASAYIARDLVTDSRRQRARLERLAQSYPSRLARTPTTPSQSGIRAEVRELLAAELARLAPLDRDIVERRAATASFADIGKALGMPAETVRDRCHAASSRLRRALERALGGDPARA